MKEEIDWERIENYLDGKLSTEDTNLFIHELKNKPDLLNEVLEMKQLKDTLNQYGKRLSLKNKLDKIHSQYQNKLNNPTEKQNNKIKIFWIHHYKTMAVAASVSILFAISTILFLSFQKSETRQSANFRALRKDMDKIKQSQNYLINNMNVEPKVDDFKQPRYTGTAFAVTQNGYFITSMHVIKDADSVFIQNQKGEIFKAITVLRNENTDIALLKVVSESFEPYKTIPYSFAEKSGNIGERVFTLGFPKDDIVYGEGSLSSLSGFEGDTVSYQISIPVNPGNSGGPLLDNNGNIIGLISGVQTETVGAAFAIKSENITAILHEFVKDTLNKDFKLNRINHLSGQSRVNQIKQMRNYVVTVKVFNNK
ncbi:MAG: serine protease [Bacteroidia bacterium]|nr:serine protease [Bacteroidia bacterium]MCZ2249611.1 S1C family serine protease [Bacteroidia bacterium]